ncbi:MAG: T9SS type A sorting domain-containing protein, partial [Bacteroidota bacterium]
NASICQGESLFVGGAVRTTPGTYRDTLTSANGCDSVITTILTVRPNSASQVNASICQGESLFVGGAVRTTPGTYRDTLTSANGCDSVITTVLTIRPHSFTTINASICDGENYLAGGVLQTSAGTYRDTLQSSNGCDSVITTVLTIRPHSFTTINASICDGENYLAGGVLQTSAGTYRDTLQSSNGCDSVITTVLTIRPHSFTTVNASICDGENYLAGGMLQTTAGTYRDTLQSSNGCDSVVTTNLSILQVYVTTIDTTICREELFNGVYYNNDTTLIDSLLSVSGCDSIIFTNIFPVICCPPPVLSCSNTIISQNQIFCGTFTLTPPDVFSLCNVVSLTSDYPGGPFPIGTTIVTWIAADQYGQADTCQQSVIYNPVNLLSSYTLLGFEEVELMPTNDVRHGAVGVMNAGGEAYLQNHTMVTGAGSFVAAPVITTFPNTQVSNPINATANVSLPAFEINPTGGGMDITVTTNNSITLTDTVYGRISLFKGATVIFDNPFGIVNAKEIKVNNKAAGAYTTLIFKQCTKVRVKERVDLGPLCTINPDSLNVIFYVEGANISDQQNQPAADIGPNAVVNADFYVPNGRFYAHPGSNVNPARYTGTFIARWITGDPDIVWTKRNDCDTSYSCHPGQLRMAYRGSEQGNPYRMDVIPNPFSNQALIQFVSNKENERITLSVMNTSGQLISLLFDETVAADRNVQVSFDSSKLPNGIYYALLRTSNGVYSTKLVVTR